MPRMPLILAALLLCAGLSACGLKGDLYLPKPKEPAASPAGPAGPAMPPASRPEEKKDEAVGSGPAAEPAQPAVE